MKKLTSESSQKWYREPTMILVICILVWTVCSGTAMLLFATGNKDEIVVSDQDYRKIKDDFRATSARDD